jgi:hypothetical protein
MRISRYVIAGPLLALAASAWSSPPAGPGNPQRLRGDYAFGGSSVCLVSPDGFDANLQPVGAPHPFPRVLAFSVEGIRTFNGDGTGFATARVVSVSLPFTVPQDPPPHVYNRGSAASVDFQMAFTYEVSSDLEVTIHTPAFAGAILTGPRAGQTETISNLPDFHGHVSQNASQLTLDHLAPGVETATFSNGDVQYRICTRARILFERR